MNDKPVIKWSNETDEQILSLNKIIYRIPSFNAISSGLTYFGPLLWQAKQTLSDLCQLQLKGGEKFVSPGETVLVYGTILYNPTNVSYE